MIMLKKARPRLTVVTATRNGAHFLPEAIESILVQTFTDFEYVIVDDASTDSSLAVVAGYAARDSRIRLVSNTASLGPAGALNRALAVACGEYVAVLDHDDLARPERLALQVAFLDATPSVCAVGAQAYMIDDTGAAIKPLLFPTHPAVARWQLLFGASLLHSTSTYRRALLEQLGGYSEGHPYLCDYELLVRMVDLGQIVNLPDELADYRRSPTQFSATHSMPQRGQKLLLQYAILWRWLGLRPDLATFSTLHTWGRGKPPTTSAEAAQAIEMLEMLFNRYCEVTPLLSCDRTAVSRACAQRWLLMAHHAYPAQRTASRVCWQHACWLDPHIMSRPETLAWMRRHPLRRQKTPQPSMS